MTPDKDAATALEACQEALAQLQSMGSIVRLSSGLGHEFNNLMQNTIGALELTQKLVEAGRASEVKPFLASALRAAQSASGINRRVVSLAGPHPSNPKPMNLNVLVTGMSDLLRQSLPRSVDLTTDFAPELWLTHCDPHRAEIAMLDMLFYTFDEMPSSRALAIKTRNRYVDEQGVTSTELVPGRYVYVEAASACDELARNAPQVKTNHRQNLNANVGGYHGLEAVREFARRNRGGATFERRDGGAIATTLYLPCLDGY